MTEKTTTTKITKMTEAEKNEIMKNAVLTAVQKHKVCNMTQLAVSMGLLKKGQSVSGSFGKKVKSLVPDIADLFKANVTNGEDGKETKETKEPADQPKHKSHTSYTMLAMEQEAKLEKDKKPAKPSIPAKPVKEPKSPKAPTKPLQKPVKAPTSGSPSLYPRHEKNPFRLNSSYGKVFDCFASFKNGVRRDELLTKVAEAVGKDLKHASYDLAVILSAKESNTGARHRSCAEGFWVRRENDHLSLEID